MKHFEVVVFYKNVYFYVSYVSIIVLISIWAETNTESILYVSNFHKPVDLPSGLNITLFLKEVEKEDW